MSHAQQPIARVVRVVHGERQQVVRQASGGLQKRGALPLAALVAGAHGRVRQVKHEGVSHPRHRPRPDDRAFVIGFLRPIIRGVVPEPETDVGSDQSGERVQRERGAIPVADGQEGECGHGVVVGGGAVEAPREFRRRQVIADHQAAAGRVGVGDETIGDDLSQEPRHGRGYPARSSPVRRGRSLGKQASAWQQHAHHQARGGAEAPETHGDRRNLRPVNRAGHRRYCPGLFGPYHGERKWRRHRGA